LFSYRNYCKIKMSAILIKMRIYAFPPWKKSGGTRRQITSWFDVWYSADVNARLSVNVALSRPAYQSSTYDDPPYTFPAWMAVDGDHSTSLFAMTCAHSAEGGTVAANPWWSVDLGVALHVHSVRLTNRDPGPGTISVYSVRLNSVKCMAGKRGTNSRCGGIPIERFIENLLLSMINQSINREKKICIAPPTHAWTAALNN